MTNAKAFLEIQKQYGSFSNYIWKFVYDQGKEALIATSTLSVSETPLGIFVKEE